MTRLELENDRTLGKSFRLSKNNPVATYPVRTFLSIAKANKDPEEETHDDDFPKLFTEFKEGEQPLEEKPPPEWLDAEIKYR